MLVPCLLFLLQIANYKTAPPPAPPPFRSYPAADAITGELARPQFRNAEERRFRAELEKAVAKGYSVVDGGTEHERWGPNFNGRYVLVQWGCGTNCAEAALIDGKDGAILRLPQIPGESLSYFGVPTGSVDLSTLEFRWNSALLGIPRIADGMTYYYALDGHQWRYISKSKTPAE